MVVGSYSTTVGYGDITPSSDLGRIAGVIAIVIGIFGYTHTITLILERLNDFIKRKKVITIQR